MKTRNKKLISLFIAYFFIIVMLLYTNFTPFTNGCILFVCTIIALAVGIDIIEKEWD